MIAIVEQVAREESPAPLALRSSARAEHERSAQSWAGPIGGPPLSPRHALLVARQALLVAGLLAYGPTRDDEDDGDRVAEVRSLLVAVEVRERGIGRALLAGAVADLERLRFAEATVWTAADNLPARGLYESAGWRRDGAPRLVEARGVLVSAVRYRRSL